MKLFDSHAHLSMLDHASEAQILERAQTENISRMVTVSTEEDNWELNRALAEKYPHIFYSLGLHPHETVRWDSVKDQMKKYFEKGVPSKCVAVGEIGLDYFYEHSDRPTQIKAFEEQLQIAKDAGLPIIIHCREAFEDLFTSLSKVGLPEKGGVMHCFTGTYEEAKKSVEMGFYVSFSGIITFKNAQSLRDTATKLPMDKILIETDCPFLAPVPNRGKPNEPSFLTHTALLIAQLRGSTLDEIAEHTTANANRLFQIKA